MSALHSASGMQCLRWTAKLDQSFAKSRTVSTTPTPKATSASKPWVVPRNLSRGYPIDGSRPSPRFVSSDESGARCRRRVPARTATVSKFYPVNVYSSTTTSGMRISRPTRHSRQLRRDTRIRGSEDDFEVEDAVDYEMDGTGEDDEDDGDSRDFDTEYDMPMGDYVVQESETFMSTEGVEEERVVDYKIDEDEFHKLSLYDCDFFIRKVPDQDNDVFDFREMYVTAPDTDTYAIPKVIGEMPKKPLRCMKSNYEYISVTEPPIDTPRAPFSKTEYQAMKVFLIKHYRNLREDHEDFVLDLENIYVIDSTTKSITKADVKVEVRRGKYRDRTEETLIVRDDGTSFKIIPTEEAHTPDEVIQAQQWDTTKESMDNYLRGFRDYDKSKWF